MLQVIIVNFDLHSKSKNMRRDSDAAINNNNNTDLYGVVIKNDDDEMTKSDGVNNGKWQWKFEEFINTQEVYSKYGISSKDFQNN